MGLFNKTSHHLSLSLTYTHSLTDTLTHTHTHTHTHTPKQQTRTTTTQKPGLCLCGAIATRSLRLQHALRTPAPREEMRTASTALSVLLSVSNLCTGQQSVNSGTHWDWLKHWVPDLTAVLIPRLHLATCWCTREGKSSPASAWNSPCRANQASVGIGCTA